MLALPQKPFPNLPRLIEKCFPAIARRRSSDEVLSSVRPWPAISLRKLFRTSSLIKNGGIRGPLSDCGRASSGFAEPPCKPIWRHRHSLMCRLDQVDVSTENR
jgi:hypothetical protein